MKNDDFETFCDKKDTFTVTELANEFAYNRGISQDAAKRRIYRELQSCNTCDKRYGSTRVPRSTAKKIFCRI